MHSDAHPVAALPGYVIITLSHIIIILKGALIEDHAKIDCQR